jgi:hypothetical protein
MQRKLMVGAVLALVLAVASVPLAFANEGPGGDDDHDGDVTVLKLTTRVLQEAGVDVPPSGDSVGDRFVFSDAVFKGDKKIGMGGVDCVVVLFKPGPTTDEPEAVTSLCVATLSLPKGQITIQGLIDFTEPGAFTLAVTGGTNAYRTAHGQVKVEEGEEEDRLTVKLILNDDRDDKDD